MGTAALRVVSKLEAGTPRSSKATVKLNLRDFFPLLLFAHRHNYQWLKDLAEDEVVVTEDLAEILRMFEGYVHQKKRA